MTIDVRKLAEEAKLDWMTASGKTVTSWIVSPAHLSAFANLVLEEAADKAEQTYEFGTREGRKRIADAIRALKVKP